MNNNNSKVVVFDLDETLGYFLEFGMLWETIITYVNNDKIQNQNIFNNLLDLYPEILRPNMIPVFKYLKHMKEKNKCDDIMIYTNNQGPKSWAIMIKNYINMKINFELFDKIIGAFKINGERVELCRTTNEKTRDDLLRCTKLPKTTQICFVDDVLHPQMMTNDIYYVNIDPYIHNISYSEMLKRFINSKIGKKMIPNKEHFIKFVRKFIKKFRYDYVEKTKEEYEIDKIVTKQLMEYLQIFFKN